MLHRRIAYLGALGAAICFQIFFRGYFSTFFLILVGLLPVLSLALSLPGLLRCTLEAVPTALTVARGEPAQFRAVLRCPAWLPLACLRVTLTVVNQLTGDSATLRRELRGVCSGASFPVEAPTSHCGRLLCSVRRARALDLLGLLSLPVRVQGRTAILVLPVPVEAELPPEIAGSEQQGRILRPRPGGGPGEDYELRDYRPGDPMRQVHWKLSTKRADLVVREVLEPVQAALLLCFDHFGPPEELDRVFDQLCSLSRRLTELERPHRILWVHPSTGTVEQYPADGERALLAALAKAFAVPAPLRGRSVFDAELPPGGRRIYVTAQGVKGGEP